MEIPADQEQDYFSPLRTFAQLFGFQCFQLPYQPEKFAWQLTVYFSTEDLKIQLHQLQYLIAVISFYLILRYSQYLFSKTHQQMDKDTHSTSDQAHLRFRNLHVEARCQVKMWQKQG